MSEFDRDDDDVPTATGYVWYCIKNIVKQYVIGAPTFFGGFQNAAPHDICAQITKSSSTNFIYGTGLQACDSIIENIIHSYSIFCIYLLCVGAFITLVYCSILTLKWRNMRHQVTPPISIVFQIDHRKPKKVPKLRQYITDTNHIVNSKYCI
jgi:hypothetical protein